MARVAYLLVAGARLPADGLFTDDGVAPWPRDGARVGELPPPKPPSARTSTTTSATASNTARTGSSGFPPHQVS